MLLLPWHLTDHEIAALDTAATWRPAEADREQTDAAVHAARTAAGTSG